MRVIDKCGLCGSENLETVLSLGASPATCVMVPVGSEAVEDDYPLELVRCHECSLVQLSTVVDPTVVFPADYPYQSGNSPALHADFEDLAQEVTSWIGGLVQDDLVVDIGANDGTLLSKFDGCRTAGVEPTKQADKIDAPVFREFFTEELAKWIRAMHGPAKIITACNVLAHVEDIHDVMRGINLLLAEDGVLVTENHDLASVVDGQWDTVYHEHLRYFDPYSFACVLAPHGLEVMDVQAIPTHGGSFRVLARKRVGRLAVVPVGGREYDFEGLAKQAAEAREKIRKSISPGMWGIGATARATTIINYCNLDVDDIACVVEVSGSDKIGHYIPGTRIPIVDEALLFEEKPTRAMLFSWHLADRIIPKLRDRHYQGTIVTPLPLPKAHRTSQTYSIFGDPWARTEWVAG